VPISARIQTVLSKSEVVWTIIWETTRCRLEPLLLISILRSLASRRSQDSQRSLEFIRKIDYKYSLIFKFEQNFLLFLSFFLSELFFFIPSFVWLVVVTPFSSSVGIIIHCILLFYINFITNSKEFKCIQHWFFELMSSIYR